MYTNLNFPSLVFLPNVLIFKRVFLYPIFVHIPPWLLLLQFSLIWKSCCRVEPDRRTNLQQFFSQIPIRRNKRFCNWNSYAMHKGNWNSVYAVYSFRSKRYQLIYICFAFVIDDFSNCWRLCSTTLNKSLNEKKNSKFYGKVGVVSWLLFSLVSLVKKTQQNKFSSPNFSV